MQQTGADNPGSLQTATWARFATRDRLDFPNLIAVLVAHVDLGSRTARMAKLQVMTWLNIGVRDAVCLSPGLNSVMCSKSV